MDSLANTHTHTHTEVLTSWKGTNEAEPTKYRCALSEGPLKRQLMIRMLSRMTDGSCGAHNRILVYSRRWCCSATCALSGHERHGDQGGTKPQGTV